MIIDSTPIRDKARRQYEKVLHDLSSARQEIERFELKDQPQFHRWMHRQFGLVLSQIHELAAKLQTQRDLLFEIQAEAMVSGCSLVRAYERVMWQREHPDEKDKSGEDEPGAKGRPKSDGSDGFHDPFGGGDDGGPQSHSRRANGQGPSTQGAPPKKPSRTLKELYRALVRRLHPDVQETMTPQKRDRWHQAQVAYQAGDVEQLQVILTLCEIDECGSTAGTSVSLLLRITREFRSSLRALKSKVNAYKRDPAWSFSTVRDHSGLARATERLMQSEMLARRSALDVVEYQIATWARQARMTPKRPSGRRRDRRQPEVWF